MPVVIPVYFDYASSLCYIAWRIAERLEAALDIEMRWRPLSIAAQYPRWEYGSLIGGDTRAKIERVAEETGVALRIPERWIDSRAALEGAAFAEGYDCITAYHREVFAAVYEGTADIGDRRVLVHIAERVGLPMEEFAQSLATRRVALQIAANLEEARRYGVTGYPTFLLGEFPLTGIQPFETMRLLFQRHIERYHAQLQ